MAKPMLEQQRAKFALGKVRPKGSSGSRGDYLIQLRQLPAQLHWGGLGQTVASLCADAKNAVRQDIYKWIEEWLHERRIYPSPDSLIDCITGTSKKVPADRVQESYVIATAEARALAVWLKKFAEAFLEEEGDHGATAAPATR